MGGGSRDRCLTLVLKERDPPPPPPPPRPRSLSPEHFPNVTRIQRNKIPLTATEVLAQLDHSRGPVSKCRLTAEARGGSLSGRPN